jgi:hypothetical protein
VAGILEHLFNTRTNGNGEVRSQWDDVLLMRDLEQLIAEERVKVLKTPLEAKPGIGAECAKKWFLDYANGDVYAHTEPWERGGARFEKCTLDDLYPVAPDQQPM